MKDLRRAFHYAGGMAPLRFLHRGGLRILVYHRFPGPASRDSLAAQCRHIRRHYRPISLSSVADHLESRRPFPPNALAVTVDDGYRDFYQHAYPVFREFGIPATVFLTTGFLDRQCWLWVDQVRFLFANSRVPEAVLPAPVAGRWRLDTPEQRAAVAREVKERAKSLPNSQRLRLLAELPAALDVALPESIPDAFAPMSWDEVRFMRRNGVEFGAHTITHPILASLSAPAEVRAEMACSKARIEAELQEPVWHFAYPNGRAADISPCAQDVARAAGFRTAVTTQYGQVRPEDDPHTLKRSVVEPELPELWFEEILEWFRMEAKGFGC